MTKVKRRYCPVCQKVAVTTKYREKDNRISNLCCKCGKRWIWLKDGVFEIIGGEKVIC